MNLVMTLEEMDGLTYEVYKDGSGKEVKRNLQGAVKPYVPSTPPTPEYVTLIKNENKAIIKTGVLTPQERDKLLVAIALKLGIL